MGILRSQHAEEPQGPLTLLPFIPGTALGLKIGEASLSESVLGAQGEEVKEEARAVSGSRKAYMKE